MKVSRDWLFDLLSPTDTRIELTLLGLRGQIDSELLESIACLSLQLLPTDVPEWIISSWTRGLIGVPSMAVAEGTICWRASNDLHRDKSFSLVNKWNHKVQRRFCALRRHLYTSESWFVVVLVETISAYVWISEIWRMDRIQRNIFSH
jgi:hypothetical protein